MWGLVQLDCHCHWVSPMSFPHWKREKGRNSVFCGWNGRHEKESHGGSWVGQGRWESATREVPADWKSWKFANQTQTQTSLCLSFPACKIPKSSSINVGMPWPAFSIRPYIMHSLFLFLSLPCPSLPLHSLSHSYTQNCSFPVVFSSPSSHMEMIQLNWIKVKVVWIESCFSLPPVLKDKCLIKYILYESVSPWLIQSHPFLHYS